MKTVTFHGFANGRAAFAEVMPDASLDAIARVAKKKGRLASKVICAEYAPNSDDLGTIYAGERAVARFTVSTLPCFLLPRR
jgi:hypothetical protein